MLNVVKHAEATYAIVKVEIGNTAIHITIQDNGKGFDPSVIKGEGIGLRSVRSKVTLLNGRLQISSNKGAGTLISIIIPNRID